MFAGIGGIDLAFDKAGFKVIWANEVDKNACYTYRLNFPNTNLVEKDIKDINVDEIPNFQVLVAGFPCQSFSSAGLKKGFDDPRGNLFFEIVRIIKAKQPHIVFFENVSNLLKHDNGNTFKVIESSMKKLGYFIRYEIINAVDFGIPQQRNRIYIVCFKDEVEAENFKFPKLKKLKKSAFDYFDKAKQLEKYYMDGHKNWKMMVGYMQRKDCVYRFTDWGISKGKPGICPTLLAAMGGPYERIPFFYDDFSIRKITQREAARLQGFSDDYQLPIKKIPKQVYKQIGNSVCVPLVQAIAREIKKVY